MNSTERSRNHRKKIKENCLKYAEYLQKREGKRQSKEGKQKETIKKPRIGKQERKTTIATKAE